MKLKKVIFKVIIFIIILIIILLINKPTNSFSSTKNQQIVILDKDNTELLYLSNEHKITPINLEYLDPIFIEMLLTIEDNKFYEHNGFNIPRIFKSLINNIVYNKSSGGSTITQQYIKNVYLSNDKTLSRKLKELYYSIKLEQLTTKDDILTKYLNCIYFGNNIYGLANASTYYFNKHYSNLDIKEMVTLIALINSPSYYSDHLDKLEERKDTLLKILLNKNIIDNDQYLIASTNITYNINPYIYSSNLLFFIDCVIDEFKDINITSNFNEVIKIHTDYNPKINNIHYDIDASYASIAINKEGFICSIIGNNNYYNSTYNIVLNGNRDIGSTIKPILYYEAIKCGFINQKYYSSPYTFKYKDELVTINNYSNHYKNEYITMEEALATSDNIYAIKMHQELGYKTLANHLKKYNINTKAIPTLALGNVGMSLYDLVKIYTQFFTDGYYMNPKYIKSITINNKTVHKTHINKKMYGNKQPYIDIKNMLASTFNTSIKHSTCSNITYRLNTKCYAKTGTTDYDAYMIGFNDDILVGAWVGYLDNQPLINNSIKKIPKEIFIEYVNSI